VVHSPDSLGTDFYLLLIDYYSSRLCGSGFQTAITAAQTIALGEADVCLTGGAEAMSMSPYTLAGASR
jgi:acetyl-CoA acetyltransferase